MEYIQIKDNLTLRQVAMNLATIVMSMPGNLYKSSYDVNDHLALARTIEKYIKGNAELPEIADNYENSLLRMFKDFKDKSFLPEPNNSKPNFEVKE